MPLTHFLQGQSQFPGSADAKTGKADSQSANVTSVKTAVGLGFHLKAGVGVREWDKLLDIIIKIIKDVFYHPENIANML